MTYACQDRRSNQGTIKADWQQEALACGFHLAHVGVHEWHAGAAITPPPEQLLVIDPVPGLPGHPMLEEDGLPMLQRKEPASQHP